MMAPAPCVLTLNAGSSSVKFAVYRVGVPLLLELHGKMDRIGLDGTHLIFQDTATDQQQSLAVAVADHSAAAMFLIDWLEGRQVFDTIRAVGHRVVHGMAHAEPMLVTTTLLGELHRITSYAPDHLPQELGLIQALHSRHPELPQLACFDTSFHCTMPCCPSRDATKRWACNATASMASRMPI
jgi:acetate kinase